MAAQQGVMVPFYVLQSNQLQAARERARLVTQWASEAVAAAVREAKPPQSRPRRATASPGARDARVCDATITQ